MVKNNILLIDFVEEARGKGATLREALDGSLRVRTRPILTTAAGMLPIPRKKLPWFPTVNPATSGGCLSGSKAWALDKTTGGSNLLASAC
ncbi:MAG: hypothetical protein WAT51_02640 [Holophaga sp.]